MGPAIHVIHFLLLILLNLHISTGNSSNGIKKKHTTVTCDRIDKLPNMTIGIKYLVIQNSPLLTLPRIIEGIKYVIIINSTVICPLGQRTYRIWGKCEKGIYLFTCKKCT